MTYLDEHDRAPARTARIRQFTQRPSETQESCGNKGSAYYKRSGVAKCLVCLRAFVKDALVGKVCLECRVKGGQ